MFDLLCWWTGARTFLSASVTLKVHFKSRRKSLASEPSVGETTRPGSHRAIPPEASRYRRTSSSLTECSRRTSDTCYGTRSNETAAEGARHLRPHARWSTPRILKKGSFLCVGCGDATASLL